VTFDPATALRHEAFGCADCDGDRFRFERPRPDAGFFKFPPTIGATGRAHLLFVGLNPRRSGGRNSNLDLHDRVMRDLAAFDDLAQDRDRGRPYLESESYYDDIRDVATAAFPGRDFSEVAAVSEFYLCASANTTHLSKSSPCAPKFLHRVIPLVAPAIIIPVGNVVANHFRRLAGVEHRNPFMVAVVGHTAHIVPSPHRAAKPNAYPPGECYESQIAVATERVAGLVRKLGLT
jgi:uracil-DNA glycosylase